MKLFAVIAVFTIFQISSISAMEDGAVFLGAKKNFSASHNEIITNVAISSALFSALYSLIDISSGNCSKKTLWQAIKDGLVTGATIGCSMAVCNELPMNVPGVIWTATVGIAPAIFVLNNFLLKRAMGLSVSE